MGSQLPDDSVMQERRARLAAERLLEKKTQELANANRKLSAHTVSLSDKIVHQRREVEKLTGENDQVNKELEVATHKIHVVERLLWDAIDTIQDGFAVYDSKLNLLAANPPYLRVFEGMNVGPGTDLHTILDLCVDEGLVDIQGMDGDSWCEMMVERWQNDEIEPVTVRFWNGIYVKMVDRRTSEGGIVSLVLNITDNVLREEELLEARDKAQAADRAKSAFLAKMSHELRTPMNGVVGMAELLLDGELDEEGELYASTIKNSGEALLSIINDVLDFSKIEAERIVLRPEPFDLERLVHDVGLIVDHMVQQKKLDFQVDYDQFLPSDFVGDAGRIRQILTNLIGNAVKFTSEGHVLVRIIGVPGEDETSCSLHVTVEDTGIGIDPAKVDHIFGEFNQIEDESNRKYEGTGLGLAITRKLVEQMGGEVWVHSVKGEGSCFGFVITLPVVQAGAKNQSQLPETVRKALVIEPNGLDLDILSRQLDLLGLQYRVFASAKAAAKYDEAGTADVIFVGHLHEILDGAETMDVLKEAFPSTPVILMLSSNDAVAPDAADHVLQKPVHRKDLFDCLVEIGNADAAPTTDAAQRQLRVLAAEDNKTNQLVFKKMLKTLDLDLTLVWNGLEAVEAYGKGEFDMVFMDISMPEMDGMEASRTIRGLEERDGKPKTPIIAMTAHAMEGDEERIRSAGVTHYLTKPLKKDKIFDVVRELAPDNTNPFPED